MFFNDQSHYVKYGFSVGKRLDGSLEDYFSDGNLDQFHTYSFEWNETALIWRFDNHIKGQVNVTNVNTFLNDPVTLFFYLRVGGHPFPNAVLPLDDIIEWTCSAFILDYVRYYQWFDDIPDQSIALVNTGEDRKSVGFCPSIMNEIRPMKVVQGSNNKQLTLVIGVSIACLIVLLALIPLIAWLLIRMRKLRDPSRRPVEQDVYDDICEMDVYEKVDGYDKEGFYHEYTEYSDIQNPTQNLYSEAIEPQTVDVRENENGYITMVANKRLKN